MSDTTTRPRLSIPYTLPEYISEVLATVGVLAMLGISWRSWPTLPVRMATHFNGLGQPDGWGGKGTLMLLPISAVLLYAAMLLCARIPHALNYPVRVTEQNAPQLYRIARRLLTALNFWVTAMLLFLEVSIIRVAQGQATGLGVWPMPIFLGCLGVTLIIAIWQMVRAK